MPNELTPAQNPMATLRPQSTAIQQYQSALGAQAQLQPGIGGKIAAGIMVLNEARLKREAKGDEKKLDYARRAYERGVAGGNSFDNIAKVITDKIGVAYPLRPERTDYFYIRRDTFTNPAAADRLLDIYGETREDGVRRLYRLPIYFHAANPAEFLHSQMAEHKGNERLFWSEFHDGQWHCRMRSNTPMPAGRRRFGPRPIVDRPNQGEYQLDGLCIPDECPNYGNSTCSLVVSLWFFVPGVDLGTSALFLKFKSKYSLAEIEKKLYEVASIAHHAGDPRGLAGTFRGGPKFWLSKMRRRVSGQDAKDPNKYTHQTHDLVWLESAIDPEQMFLEAEHRREPAEALARGKHAAAVLNAPFIDGETDDTDTQESDIDDLLAQACIDPDAFAAFAANQWGDDWRNQPQVAQLLAEDPEGIKEAMQLPLEGGASDDADGKGKDGTPF